MPFVPSHMTLTPREASSVNEALDVLRDTGYLESVRAQIREETMNNIPADASPEHLQHQVRFISAASLVIDRIVHNKAEATIEG